MLICQIKERALHPLPTHYEILIPESETCTVQALPGKICPAVVFFSVSVYVPFSRSLNLNTPEISVLFSL